MHYKYNQEQMYGGYSVLLNGKNRKIYKESLRNGRDKREKKAGSKIQSKKENAKRH